MPLTDTQNPRVTGARTDAAEDERTASAAVQKMFSDIAPRYDLLNHLLSMNVDRFWWWRVARTFRHILERDGARVLDLCCGTGDMAFALLRRAGHTRIEAVGVDFAHPMLVRARQKPGADRVTWIEADALHLPLPDANFDLVTSAFGFRNLANYDAGLREIHRVLCPGGEIGVLDFGEPRGLFGHLYRFYFRRVLPVVGGAISGDRRAYAYLPASVSRFPSPDEMVRRLESAGFADVSWTPYTFGIAGLYRGKKN